MVGENNNNNKIKFMNSRKRSCVNISCVMDTSLDCAHVADCHYKHGYPCYLSPVEAKHFTNFVKHFTNILLTRHSIPTDNRSCHLDVFFLFKSDRYEYSNKSTFTDKYKTTGHLNTRK